MRFITFMKANADTEAGVMPSEAQLRAMGEYNQAMADAGILRGGEGLHPSSRGVRVTFGGGDEPVVTDGPFAETKELVAGFWLIEADSLEQAVDWAKRCPDDGKPFEIEIRPLFEAADFGEEFTPELQAAEDQLRQQLNTLSSDELRELVEQINDAWIRNDPASVIAHVTDDVRWNMVGHDIIEGKSAFIKSFETMPSMTTLEFKQESLLVDGARASLSGTMRTRDDKGKESQFAFCDIYEFRGDKIASITSYVMGLDEKS